MNSTPSSFAPFPAPSVMSPSMPPTTISRFTTNAQYRRYLQNNARSIHEHNYRVALNEVGHSYYTFPSLR